MGVGFDYSLYFLKQAAGTWTGRANFSVQSISLRSPFVDGFMISEVLIGAARMIGWPAD
jgi:hypothetical protein